MEKLHNFSEFHVFYHEKCNDGSFCLNLLGIFLQLENKKLLRTKGGSLLEDLLKDFDSLPLFYLFKDTDPLEGESLSNRGGNKDDPRSKDGTGCKDKTSSGSLADELLSLTLRSDSKSQKLSFLEDGIRFLCQSSKISIHAVGDMNRTGGYLSACSIPRSGRRSAVIFDCCPSLEILPKISLSYDRVLILDHHLSTRELFDSKQAIPKNVKLVFSNDVAASKLSWSFFESKFGKLSEFLSPDLLESITKTRDCVNAQDLGDFSFPNNVHFYLGCSKLNLGSIEDNRYECSFLKYSFDTILTIGKGAYQNFEQNLDSFTKDAEVVTSSIQTEKGKIEFRIVHKRISKGMSDISYIGRALSVACHMQGDSPIVMMSKEMKGNLRVSLRSLGSEHSCLDIAKHFGGGGHFNAAGFLISPKNLAKDFRKVGNWKRKSTKPLLDLPSNEST